MADRTLRLGHAGLAGDAERARRLRRRRDPSAPQPARTRAASVPAVGWLAQVRALEERPRVVGPHARLGVVWFAIVLAALFAGRAGLVLLLAPVAGLAALQALRSRRARAPSPAVAGGGALLLVIAAAFGPVAAGVVLLVLLLLIGANVVAQHHRRDPLVALATAVAVGVACAAPVLLLQEGAVPVFVLLTYAAVYDASAYVVGTGAHSSWEGPAAGVASIAAVTLAVAAVLVPPFRGASPWILGGLAALSAPMGPFVGSALLGDRRANVPALRRLDSLLVLAPVWCLVAAFILE